MKRTAVHAFVLLVLVWFTACAKTRYTATPIVHSQKGVVVSAHPLASGVGVSMLELGGNATDAAIATQFALAVVCPRAGNLGGGGFWVQAPFEDAVRSIDYREKAPEAATRDMFLDENGEVHPHKSLAGPLAAGIPGQVDGLYLAYTFSSELKNWSTLIQPSIVLARKGYPISPTEANLLNEYRAEFLEQNSFDFPFVKNEPWRAGDLMIQTTLANTLDSIASRGPSFFYERGFAERLAGEVRERGGIWTAKDLENYHSTFREPIQNNFKGFEVSSMPPPSSGGIVLGQMLGMLEAYDLANLLRTDTVAYYHVLIEAMRRAYEDRASYLGDPDFVKVEVDTLLDGNYLAAKWKSFDALKASKSKGSLKSIGKDVFETTHTSVIDALGNAVAVTTTLNGNFGSKTWSQVGGFFLNNEMDDFSAKPGVANQFGLTGGEANAIAPGKRMLSSMTPTIIRQDGEVVLVLGSPGGSTIITAVLQVMLNHLVHNMPLDEAVSAPRLHHQWLPDEVLYEEGVFSARVKSALEAKGHELRQVKTIGRVKSISRNVNGLTGVGDKRNPDDTAAAAK